MIDHIIDRSPAQKLLRIEIMRLELKPLGYSVVQSGWLHQMIKRLPVADRTEAGMEAVR